MDTYSLVNLFGSEELGLTCLFGPDSVFPVDTYVPPLSLIFCEAFAGRMCNHKSVWFLQYHAVLLADYFVHLKSQNQLPSLNS